MNDSYLEKTMASGEVMTLASADKGFDVDQWDKNGANRWHRYYPTYQQAKAEYDRWN